MVELKPCPFCGKSVAVCGTVAEIEILDEDNEFYGLWNDCFAVACNYNVGGCGSMTGGQYYTAKEAIEAWNRRVSDE